MSCDILVVSYKYVREHLVPRILGGKVAEASLVMPVHRSSPWLADTCHSLRRHQPCLLYVSPFGQNRNYPWKPHPAKQLWLCLSWFSCLWDPWSSDSQAPLLFLFHTNWTRYTWRCGFYSTLQVTDTLGHRLYVLLETTRRTKTHLKSNTSIWRKER